ncbi:MAG: alpha/beta fold hydrolase [Flavobacteriaceae bacterium]|nr:alpha/beta fold hydrolase [Flavobacteriaceae bacterium]
MSSYSEYRAKQNQFVTIAGSISFIDEGQGPVLLLLHGIPTSGWLYRKMIPLLVSAGYRVIVPDMLGFGSSSSPKGYELYSEDKQADRIIALMDYLKIDKWTHVFHDAAGLWTWELCKQHANRIENLVILNTVIYAAGFKPPMRFGNNVFTKIIMKLYSYKLLNRILLKQLFNGGLIENKLSEEDLNGYKTPLLEGKVKGMYYFFSRTCHNLPDYKKVISELNIPTMVIWGKEDPFLHWKPQSKAVIKELKIAPENIHLLDAKHFIQEEQPDRICELIQNFIK